MMALTHRGRSPRNPVLWTLLCYQDVVCSSTDSCWRGSLGGKAPWSLQQEYVSSGAIGLFLSYGSLSYMIDQHSFLELHSKYSRTKFKAFTYYLESHGNIYFVHVPFSMLLVFDCCQCTKEMILWYTVYTGVLEGEEMLKWLLKSRDNMGNQKPWEGDFTIKMHTSRRSWTRQVPFVCYILKISLASITIC